METGVAIGEKRGEGVVVQKFDYLKETVIDPGYCHRCGACTAFCNRMVMGKVPKLTTECHFTGSAYFGNRCVCYGHCPMVSIVDPKHIYGVPPKDELLGTYRGIKAARSKDETILRKAQDGGVATTLLKAALENEVVDAVIAVCRDEKWKPIPRIITTPSELKRSCGSTYAPAPVVHLLGKVSRERAAGKNAIGSIAIVGMPCQIQAVRNLEFGLLYNNGLSPTSELKVYTLSLFCEGIYDYDRLLPLLDTDVSEIRKMDIKGKLIVHADEISCIPLTRLRGAMLDACKVCLDFAGEQADLSIGSVGSPQGWSTLFLRSRRGAEFLRDSHAAEYLEMSGDVDLEGVKKAAAGKKKRVREEIQRRRAAGIPLPPVLHERE
jgi:coenzyme F420 hydrogenase subunit beta